MYCSPRTYVSGDTGGTRSIPTGEGVGGETAGFPTAKHADYKEYILNNISINYP
jgi:hypothetical protein